MMSDTVSSFDEWVGAADIPDCRLTPEVLALLRAAFRFCQHQGTDYYSRRLLCHFLLHCDCGLKIAQVARLTGFGRATASRNLGLSSKEVVQSAHQRLLGRAHGKLLPRYAGPVAAFLTEHPQATHYDTLDFLERSLGVSVSLPALHTFLSTYGLDRATRRGLSAPTDAAEGDTPIDAGGDPESFTGSTDPPAAVVPATVVAPPAAGQPLPLPPPACLL